MYFAADPYNMAATTAFDFMMRPPLLWPMAPPVIDRELLEGMADVQIYDQLQLHQHLQQQIQQIQQITQHLPAATKGDEPLPPGIEEEKDRK